MASVRAAVAVLGAVLGQTVNDIALNIWPIVTAPVLTDMKPGSSALSYLNSGGNLGRESAAVPRRVGMVFTARDWWLGAPFVAGAPDEQYWGHAGVVAGINGLEQIRAYFDYPNFVPWDGVAQTIRMQASMIISNLLIYNSVWCYATSYDPSCSMSTDGVVPTPAQYFPGNARTLASTAPRTSCRRTPRPTLWPTSWSIASACARERLTWQIPATRWTTGIDADRRGAFVSRPIRALAQRRLHPHLPDGRQPRALRPRRRTVVEQYAGSSPGFAGHAGRRQSGRLSRRRVPIWATDTPDIPGAELRVQDDGYIVLYDAGGNVVWYAPNP